MGRDINAALKKRMGETAAAAAQNERLVEDVYEVLIGGKKETAPAKVNRECRAVPANKLRNFFTAQIGFRSYSQADLEALAEDIGQNGLLEYGIARPIPGTDEYEVLSGRNRRDACILCGWELIPFNIETCDDARAIIIATVTNLKRRQHLLHSERGWAYRALLEVQRCQGKRTDLGEGASVEIQQKLTTRDKVARVFGVKPHEVQRDIRLTYLIQPLLDAVDERRLKIGYGTVLAGYEETAQQAFLTLWQDKGTLPPKLLQHMKIECPPPACTTAALKRAWAGGEKEAALTCPPQVSLSFDRKQFEPIISKLENEGKLQELFLEFLQQKVSALS